MEKSLPKNHPTLCESVLVNRLQFDHIFTDAAAAKGDEIAKSLATLKDDIAPAADKRFVLFKNKFVWFDREVSALFPRMEKKDLPTFRCRDGAAARDYSETREGFLFVPMTLKESKKTFAKNNGNPYVDFNNSNMPLKYYANVDWYCEIILGYSEAKRGSDCGGGRNPRCWWRMRENNVIGCCGGRGCDLRATLVPIHRLRGKNAAAMSYIDSLFTWIKLGLVPEGLKPKQEKLFQSFIDDYAKIEEYVSFDDNKNIIFDGERFKRDVLGGKFTAKVFDYDFDIKGTLEGVMDSSRHYTGSVASLKQELLNCDFKRANIEPYDERLLIDVNRGHWELFEDSAKDSIQVQLPAAEMLVARPPQLDVRLNGICAIDFGTKNTIVVCRDGESRMLRIGKGDYSKAPTVDDFQNPTVIELRDLQNFLAAYRQRTGRPFTEWNQVTVSHKAAEAIFKENVGSSVYNSVFSELKQWAKDEQSYPVLKDLQGAIQEIKPYLETDSIDAGDFDPIELYAYYLGLYINNMHRQIYLDYILSYPVNYRKDVREHIRQSFERGIRKSLPPALLADEEIMKRFRVYLGASEPAAYAISALEGFKLEPKQPDDKIAYGVFDFGGGTTDFDFGIEYVPENHRRNFIIEQFGFNGDALLGGENILELLAYEVYKDNLQIMHDKKIPFALPAGCEVFAGAETLVSRTRDSAAHMNNRILAEALRPIWENTDRTKLTEDALPLKLFAKESVPVTLKIDVDKLDGLIERRIREGVVNFFQSLKVAFAGKDISPIHIFLAGNSCRSPLIRKIFDEFISREDGEFILHMPLGMDFEAELLALANKLSAAENIIPAAKEIATLAREIGAEELAELAEDSISKAERNERSDDLANAIKAFFADKNSQSNVMELDRQRTGKTGVAFGLIRCRRGGKDIQIVNRNVDANDEMIFPYFLGDAGNDGNTFTVKISREVGYGVWTYFTFADEPEFELYYTTEPRALKGDLAADKVKMIHCLLDDTSDAEDIGVYVRKVTPNQIEYAVGRADDFQKTFSGKIYRQTL